MALLAAIVLGLIVGLVFNKFFDESGETFVLDLFVGALGASAGRSIAVLLRVPDAAGLNLIAACVALSGALVLLTARRGISGDRHRAPVTRRIRRR